MAPGPLGQCHPLPDDKNVRLELARVAKNYAHVHQMYNLDWDPEPGSVQHMVEARMKRAEELQMRRLERMAVNAAKVSLGGAGEGGGSGKEWDAGVWVCFFGERGREGGGEGVGLGKRREGRRN